MPEATQDPDNQVIVIPPESNAGGSRGSLGMLVSFLAALIGLAGWTQMQMKAANDHTDSSIALINAARDTQRVANAERIAGNNTTINTRIDHLTKELNRLEDLVATKEVVLRINEKVVSLEARAYIYNEEVSKILVKFAEHQEVLKEVEEQFRRLFDALNLTTQQQDAFISLLWEKVYVGERFPKRDYWSQARPTMKEQ